MFMNRQEIGGRSDGKELPSPEQVCDIKVMFNITSFSCICDCTSGLARLLARSTRQTISSISLSLLALVAHLIVLALLVFNLPSF